MNVIISFKTKNSPHSLSENVEESIKNNFEKAKEFLISEDWIYKNTKIFK